MISPPPTPPGGEGRCKRQEVREMHIVYLGLGSNLGDREALLREAIRRIGDRVGQVVRQSSFIETEPWGFESDHPFLNAVICIDTALTPRELLLATQQIERDMGRKKNPSGGTTRHSKDNSLPAARHYTDRPIDIDILLYDDLTVDEPDLQIPHPLMQQRDFVMTPLREISNL